MTRFSFPARRHFEVLLDSTTRPPRERLRFSFEDPDSLLRGNRRPDGSWEPQNRHPGRTHFELEEIGKPTRWTTLRARLVLRWWESA